MSSTREELIRQGLLKPRAPSSKTPRFPKSEEQRDADRLQIDHIAKQLYNVFVGKAKELDPEDEDLEVWEDVEQPFKELFRAMAAYVLSTYKDNERLRARVAKLENRNP